MRQIPDTLAIRQGLDRQPRVVIVGGGWIGLEVASGALRLGAQVTLVECEPRLCARAVPPRLSTYLQDVHQSQGVDVRCGVSVESFEGDRQVERARLSDGTTLEIDMAVLGIGIIPNSELAQQAGLEVDNGVLVDEFCRTSDPDILAAGDVTNHPNSLLGRRLRLEVVAERSEPGHCSRQVPPGTRRALPGDSLVLVRSIRPQHPTGRPPQRVGHRGSSRRPCVKPFHLLLSEGWSYPGGRGSQYRSRCPPGQENHGERHPRLLRGSGRRITQAAKTPEEALLRGFHRSLFLLTERRPQSSSS